MCAGALKNDLKEGARRVGGALPAFNEPGGCCESRCLALQKSLLDWAGDFDRRGDVRWFFTYAHAMVMQEINLYVGAFLRPERMLRLNERFAASYLEAIGGNPHAAWERVFRRCEELKRHGGLWLTHVVAGRLMAKVHIEVDLVASLCEVRGIPPVDYGNALSLVERGTLAAVDALERRMTQRIPALIRRILARDVRTWRKAAFLNAYHIAAPPVQERFRPWEQDRTLCAEYRQY